MEGMMNHQAHNREISTELRLFENPWKITKRLTSSDVDKQQCRLLLPTDIVEAHIPRFLIAEANTPLGTRVTIRDLNTGGSDHELTFKRWPSSNSYVFINNWATEFVRRRELRSGDEIGLFWDPTDSDSPHFCFSAFRNGRVLLG